MTTAGYHATVLAQIESAELARYVAPGRALARPHGLVVRLRIAAGDRRLVGVGEAVVAGNRTGPAWRELRRVVSEVVGATLPPAVDQDRPLDGISGWQPVAATDRGARRSAKLALEMALLDALSKGGQLAWGGSLLPTPPGVVDYPVPPGPPGDEPSAASEPAPVADTPDGWAWRLRLTGDAARDLAWIRDLRLRQAKSGHTHPLWLVGGGRTPAAAADFVSQLAASVDTGEMSADVWLEDPLHRRPQSLLSKLRQRSILARLPQRSALRTLQQRAGNAVSLVAGAEVASAAQAATMARQVACVRLSLASFSSLLGLRVAAQTAKRANPRVRVMLSGERGSRITEAALAAIAAATPEIDRYVPEPKQGSWPALVGEVDLAQGGLVGEVDLAELATVADDVTAEPEPEFVPTAEPANQFPDYPLAGTALAVRSMLLETEALRIGLGTRRIARDYFLLEAPGGDRVSGLFDSESNVTSFATAVSASDKGITRALLEAAGLPIPQGATFPARAQAAALEAAMRFGYPLVVKPAGGSKGTAVTVDINSESQLRQALAEVTASKYAETGIVVERFVTGDDYRILATRDEVLSVIRREPASVVGDGRRSVEELVLAANVVRRHNPHLAKRLIVLDGRVDDQLARQSLTRRSIPAAGQRVRLRAEGNLSLGGDSREVLDELHPSVAELAMAAVAAIPGLPYAGLDVLLHDHRRPVAEQAVSILEVNSRPVQSMHHFPMYGPPRNVSARLVSDAARAMGVAPSTPADLLTVEVAVSMRAAGAPYRRWLGELAAQLDVAGWVRAEGDGHRVLAHGPASRVGLLLRMAFQGPAGSQIVETVARPVETAPPSGFRVERRSGKEQDG